jgi:hypothetical protein
MEIIVYIFFDRLLKRAQLNGSLRKKQHVFLPFFLIASNTPPIVFISKCTI